MAGVPSVGEAEEGWADEKAVELLGRRRLDSDDLVTLNTLRTRISERKKLHCADEAAAVPTAAVEYQDVGLLLSLPECSAQAIESACEDVFVDYYERAKEIPVNCSLQTAVDERLEELRSAQKALRQAQNEKDDLFTAAAADHCLSVGFNSSELVPALAAVANADPRLFYGMHQPQQNLIAQDEFFSPPFHWSVGSADFRDPLFQLFKELDTIPRPVGLLSRATEDGEEAQKIE